MVHSAVGHGAMYHRDSLSTALGIPKSPSFHSGLDLVAAVETAGLKQLGSVDIEARPSDDLMMYSSLPIQLPSLLGKYSSSPSAHFDYTARYTVDINT